MTNQPISQEAIDVAFLADRIERVRVKLDFLARLMQPETDLPEGMADLLVDMAQSLESPVRQLKATARRLCPEA